MHKKVGCRLAWTQNPLQAFDSHASRSACTPRLSWRHNDTSHMSVYYLSTTHSRAEAGPESSMHINKSQRGFRFPTHRWAYSPPLHQTSMPGVFLSPRPPLAYEVTRIDVDSRSCFAVGSLHKADLQLICVQPSSLVLLLHHCRVATVFQGFSRSRCLAEEVLSECGPVPFFEGDGDA